MDNVDGPAAAVGRGGGTSLVDGRPGPEDEQRNHRRDRAEDELGDRVVHELMLQSVR